jgi:RND family efflux transporter MFP subunit
MKTSLLPIPTSAPSSSTNLKRIGLGLAVVFSALAVLGASRFKRAEPPPPRESATMTVGASDVTLTPNAPQYKVLRLAPAKAMTARFGDLVPARVTADETRSAKVGSPLSGRVTQVFVELGQSVKTGDPLFSVTSPDLAGLRAERDKAAVDLDVTRTQLARVKAMVEARALPAKDELEADQQLRQAKLALRLAQSKFASLKVSSRGDNEFTVVAPRDGTIVQKDVLPSQEVSPEGSLLSVVDLDHVWVVAELFEADAMGIRESTLAQITIPSLPGFSAETEVQRVSAVVDPSRHTVPVRMRLANPTRQLKPNTYAQVRFAIDPTVGAVEIASTAVVSSGASKYVYVEEGPGKFARREVTTGSLREGFVPVFAGLREAEVVVQDGAILLDNQISLSN